MDPEGVSSALGCPATLEREENVCASCFTSPTNCHSQASSSCRSKNSGLKATEEREREGIREWIGR